MGQEDYQELSSFLKRFIRRFKFLQGVEGLCLTAICAVVLVRSRPGRSADQESFSPTRRWFTASLTAVILVVAIGWTLLRLLRRLSHECAAVYIERKQPKLRNNLINSLQLYPQITQVRRRAGLTGLFRLDGARAYALDAQANRHAASRRSARYAAVKSSLRLLAIVVVRCWPWYCSIHPGSATLSVCSLVHWIICRLRKPNLDVHPKGVRVVRGTPVTIQVATAGAVPETVRLDSSGARATTKARPRDNGKTHHGKSWRRQVQV